MRGYARTRAGLLDEHLPRFEDVVDAGVVAVPWSASWLHLPVLEIASPTLTTVWRVTATGTSPLMIRGRYARKVARSALR
jgi:hypothetical protein